MIITKEANGTMSYSGIAFDILEYIARALSIRLSHDIHFNIKLVYNYLITF